MPSRYFESRIPQGISNFHPMRFYLSLKKPAFTKGKMVEKINTTEKNIPIFRQLLTNSINDQLVHLALLSDTTDKILHGGHNLLRRNSCK